MSEMNHTPGPWAGPDVNRRFPACTGDWQVKAWVIKPSGKMEEIEFAKGPVLSDNGWDGTSTCSWYRVRGVHPTKDVAISAGLAALDVQQAKLTKQQTALDKKRATLIAAREKA